SELRERIARVGGAQHDPDRQDAEQDRDDAAENQSELLACNSEDEVRMRIGNAIFDRACAGTDAEQTPMRERLEREACLIAGFVRVEELRHAMANMRKQRIGKHTEADTCASQRTH